MGASVSSAATYETFALRFASHHGRKSTANFLGEDPFHASDMPLDFFFWLIRGHGRVILVDTGFTPETAARRGRHYHAHPLELLKSLGVAAGDVTDVIVTHMHYDHAGNLAAFPEARIHMQEAELQYCAGRYMCHPLLRRHYEAEDVAAVVRCLYGGRMRFASSVQEIAPGVSTHLCGGHTAGMQYVTVNTERGEILLASDAAHYYENLRQRRPLPILLDLAGCLDAFERIAARVTDLDRVIPGHDPAVLSAFPRIRSNPNIVEVHSKPIASLTFQGSAVRGNT